MSRLSYIFFFKISIGYNMNASKFMKSFAASVAESKKKSTEHNQCISDRR